MARHITLDLDCDNNEILMKILGPHDLNLKIIEQRFGIIIRLNGAAIQLEGSEPELSYAQNTLQYLKAQIQKGFDIDSEQVESAIRIAGYNREMAAPDCGVAEEVSIHTKRRIIYPRTPNQAKYIQQLKNRDLVFGVGPAGTGKTYLAAAIGVSMLLAGKVEKIILSRPAVEAGERLGFLPGDLREKVDPYLRPLYDALYDMLPSDQVQRFLNNGEIEIAPLAFMRGRTLSNAFIILDEAQNTTSMQMKMFLTRLGNNSRMVVTGDITQIDLPLGVKSGLKEVIRILQPLEEIKIIKFNGNDVVRHPLVSLIVQAYEQESVKITGLEDN